MIKVQLGKLFRVTAIYDRLEHLYKMDKQDAHPPIFSF
jgi:hypothetical protein